MKKKFQVISPIDNHQYLELSYSSQNNIQQALSLSSQISAQWKFSSLSQRKQICLQAVENILAQKSMIAEEICWQMGRPIRYCEGEVLGFAERARYMIDIAEHKLANIQISKKNNIERFIQRNPCGNVFVIAPWNYPYLTAVNAIIPAIMAGNSVILKPSSQTPLTARRIEAALHAAGLPNGVFQSLYLDHESTEKLVKNSNIDFVSFTGSVAGGRQIQAAAATRFIGMGLELGGKDAAYVRPDADLEKSVESLVDGAYFNSGQSCCGIERIYVHEHIYESFLAQFVEKVKLYQLGNPLNPETELGPMVSIKAANHVRKQTNAAIADGATACIPSQLFAEYNKDSPYLAPQVLTEVDHSMSVMKVESFGPVVGIMQVTSDEAAMNLINDSEFGLTASVWTTDEKIALKLGQQAQVGTWFMNRCDYLDPALAWTGLKNSGRGCSLSEIGYEQLTQTKSFHLKLDL